VARLHFARHRGEVLTGGELMPSNDHLFSTAARVWLRAQVDRVRRSVMSQRPAVRWIIAVLVVVGLTSAIYWAAASYTTLGVRYLVSGRRFSSDDLIKVCSALDKQRLNYRVDDSRRVEVAADQYDQAADVVAKLDFGQRPIGEIRDESYASWFLDSPADREYRKQLAREKIIEGLIDKKDGVVWSLVSINRHTSKKWPQVSTKPTAFVYIETEGNRQLPYHTAQSITEILTGWESDLTPGSITVMDRRGTRYFESGNLAIGDASRDRAREEDLGKEILDKLDWVKGVRVHVKVSSPAEPAVSPSSGLIAAHRPIAHEQNGGTKTEHPTLKLESDHALPSMEVNGVPAPEPEPAPPPSAVEMANGSSTKATRGGDSGETHRQRPREPGRVLIYVPRSFYLNADIRPDNHEPSREDLRLMTERTENQIKTAVSLVTPSSESWKVDIFTIADEISPRPVNLQSAADARRRVLDWGIIGTVVAIVSILAAMGSWIQVARRPVPAPGPAPQTRRYHVDTASEPGPSERVRELVRRSPEAAASVLQRWTGQGGRA
jgi:flagellar M-ring protein FliF